MRAEHLMIKMKTHLSDQTDQTASITQKEFEGKTPEEQAKLKLAMKESLYFNNESLLKDFIPLAKNSIIPIKSIEDVILKFTDLSYQPIRNQNGEQKKIQE